MPTDLDIEALIAQKRSFVRVNSIDYATTPIHQVIMSCHQWGRERVPFVVHNIPLDTGPETPFGGSTEWLIALFSAKGQSSPSRFG